MRGKNAKIVVIIGIIVTLLSGCGGENILVENQQIATNIEVEKVETNVDVDSEILATVEEDKKEILSDAEIVDDVEENISEEKETTTEETVSKEIEEEQTTEIEVEVPNYTFTEMSVVKFAKAAVNVRSLPSTDGERIGGLAIGDEVSVTGVCNETGWYRINYGNRVEAFVSDKYLVNEKPITEIPVSTQNSEQSDNVSIANTQTTTTPVGGNGHEGGSSVTIPEHEETEGNLVWVPVNGGTKYHTRSSCSNMNDPMQVSLETALANGYTACKRCH